ncbi:hypothetical protein G6N82_13960 [Altererythrobacter sp. BO-6]|uniref:pilus assembly protein TadG-related protein n=1 Tax=Altererythrobacter sp. BO-6 TaxID=2604537 RepID=UPI0013E0FBA0|nr:pilus assembly protein TadG-related protein [Altererythrobacter sp. BO-6]QIG55104.1 hypothetical protein G6N82_13960 [Altererythrobacter sp. BO-6]
MITKARYRRFLKDQNGAVAATYALALFGLLGILGLAFDYARMVGMHTELQNAADQAALAGASQLDREPGAMARAVTAIQGGLAENSTVLANDGDGQTVTFAGGAEVNVFFYRTRAEAEAGGQVSTATTDAEAGYVGVFVDGREVNYAFTPIVGALASGDLVASAVAGMGSALCRIPPLMICNPDEDFNGGLGDENANFDLNRVGTGMLVVEGPTGSGPSYWQPGNYGFLDLGNGAQAVSQGLGWIGPPGGCISIEGNETIAPDTEPGLKTGAIDAINTRFDIYENNSSCPAGGQCPSAFNARKDLVRTAQSTPPSGQNACSISNNNTGWHETSGTRYLPPTNSALPDTVTPTSMGHPRDICHAVSSAGVCSEGKFGDGIWDRDAYFRSHYGWDRATWQTYTKTGNSPVPNNTPTRYQVYLWEVANAGDTINGVKILETDPVGATGATEIRQAKPVCSANKTFEDPDRRVMTIAVVNCTAEQVRGKTQDVAIADWLDVFLVQPSAARDRTSKSDIYFEVIRKTNITRTGAPIGPTIRRDMPYLVR